MTKQNIHKAITANIIEALEAGTDKFQLPWHKVSNGRPTNIASKKPYNGVNVLNLWASAFNKGYISTEWGTYKQWQAKDAQVRKGEKGTMSIFYKKVIKQEEENDDLRQNDPSLQGYISDSDLIARSYLRTSMVFNAEQVDNYTQQQPARPAPLNGDLFTQLPEIDTFIKNTGARIEEKGDTACYFIHDDYIQMPSPELFIGTPTSTVTESYYATHLHELVHWTGHKSRCDRDMTGNRQTDTYAFEELIAELGATFLCADLNISASLRPDHAAYLKIWLESLKKDDRAIFKAAAKASKATQFLHDAQATASTSVAA